MNWTYKMKIKYFIILLILIIPLTLKAYSTKDITNYVVKSLKNEPHKWRANAYKIYYFKDKVSKESNWQIKSDCIIWIANGWEHIKIEHPRRILFTQEQKKIIWDIYTKNANKFIAENIFDNIFVSKKIEQTKEQNIKKKVQLLKTFDKKEQEPIKQNSCAFWQLIALLEFVILLAGVGMVGYINRRSE